MGQCGDIIHMLDDLYFFALFTTFSVGVIFGHLASGMFTRIDFYFRHVIRERAKALRYRQNKLS